DRLAVLEELAGDLDFLRSAAAATGNQKGDERKRARGAGEGVAHGRLGGLETGMPRAAGGARAAGAQLTMVADGPRPASAEGIRHQTCCVVPGLTVRTLPSHMATRTTPAEWRLRALACWNGQGIHAPMPPLGSSIAPSQSSALGSRLFGTVQSQV